MCSWCYGFSPQLDKVFKNFPEVPTRIIVGGLRAGGEETFKDLASFLKEHWYDVHKKTNQPFSYSILDKKGLIYNTEPACRAVVVVRTLSPALEYDYFKTLQSAFYADNLDPTDLSTFVTLAKNLGIDEAKFTRYFNSPVILNETERDFLLSHSLEVQGFPSLIALKNGKLHRITNGYDSADSIIAKLVLLGFQPLAE